MTWYMDLDLQSWEPAASVKEKSVEMRAINIKQEDDVRKRVAEAIEVTEAMIGSKKECVDGRLS